MDKLQSNFSRRFQGGFKQVAPYNCLTVGSQVGTEFVDFCFNLFVVHDLSIDGVYDEA